MYFVFFGGRTVVRCLDRTGLDMPELRFSECFRVACVTLGFCNCVQRVVHATGMVDGVSPQIPFSGGFPRRWWCRLFFSVTHLLYVGNIGGCPSLVGVWNSLYWSAWVFWPVKREEVQLLMLCLCGVF